MGIMLFFHAGLNMTNILPTPADFKKNHPLPLKVQKQIDGHRHLIAQSLHGQSSRFIILMGPCSIDNSKAALVYAKRLKTLQHQNPELLFIMRTYMEKPRTTIGWTGFINDPECLDQHNPLLGIQKARQLLLEINSIGVPCAAELLNPLLAPYYADLLSYASIGARTSESQVHRQLAASLPMPIGIKNPTGGDLTVAAHSVYAATQAHPILALNNEGNVESKTAQGNPNAHLILRGSRTQTNYCKDSMGEALAKLNKHQCPNRFLIDCSHGNSAGCHHEQEQVAKHLIDTLDQHPELAGIMLESYLESGNQSVDDTPRVFGKSITDACLSWEASESLIARVSAKQHTTAPQA